VNRKSSILLGSRWVTIMKKLDKNESKERVEYSDCDVQLCGSTTICNQIYAIQYALDI
jgi:hypothetical protein